jgi:hypothetical protein
MNKKKIKQLRGWVRIYPSPKIEVRGNSRHPDFWFADEYVSAAHIRLSYSATGHSKDIGLDHIVEYRTDSFVNMGQTSKGIIILKTQIVVRGQSVLLEPLRRPPLIE